MSKIDYMKVIDIISKVFNVDTNFELNASHEKVDIFEIKMQSNDGEINYKILLYEYYLEIIFKKTIFENRNYSKWVNDFEYELEQTFFINVKLEKNDNPSKYILKINF